MSLKEYNRKRKFSQTPEPRGKSHPRTRGAPRFVVQMHSATRLHYDLRLEFGGVFRSWAVPKGPSLDPMEQRLAVFVEDHPLAYGSFEGIIPRGNYGAGTVLLWDQGTYLERGSKNRAETEKAMLKGLEKGHLTFVLEGEKLRGEFALVRLKDRKSWLLVKKRDAFAQSQRQPLSELSVKTGRSLEQIARVSAARGDVWISRQKTAPVKKKAPLPAARIPSAVKLAQPVVAKAAFAKAGWIYQGLHAQGVRVLAEISSGRAQLFSRTRLPLSKKYPKLCQQLSALSERLILDGEVLPGEKFSVLDLIYDGEDLRDLPLSERLQRLSRLKIFDKVLSLNPAQKSPSQVSSELVLARELGSPYRGGIQKSWQRFARVTPESEGPRLTHLEKIYFPREGIRKGEVIDYYRAVSSLILPYLRGRPQSLNRHPNGIAEPGFFQKDMTGFLPRWIKTQRIYSESSGKSINYLLCEDERTLLYMANLGCIEINPWFSTVAAIENPTYCVIDLDPDGHPFTEVMKIALDVRKVLDSLRVESYCKTSGGDGLHVCVPLGARFSFDESKNFAEAVCRAVNKRHPRTTSVERSPAKRRGKIYLDFLQNRRGQTLASVYGLRPRAGAPVSIPLHWDELRGKLRPDTYNIRTALKRFAKVGDLWRPVLEGKGQEIVEATEGLLD